MCGVFTDPEATVAIRTPPSSDCFPLIGINAMTDLLRRLIAWASRVYKPRQARRPPSRGPRATTSTSPLQYPSLPAHRSPYCADAFIDGTSTVPVRPYLVAHEQRQHYRELNSPTPTLPAAGPHWLDGVEAA